MKSVLHIIDSLGRGGAETLLMGYLTKLDTFDHVIVTFRSPNEFEKITAKFHFYQLDVNPPKQFRKATVMIRKLIRKHRIDIVHSHSFWSNIISRFATPTNTKLFNHYHFADYDTMYYKNSVKVMVFLDRLVQHKNLIRIAVSDYVKKILQKHFRRKDILLLTNYVKCNHSAGHVKNLSPKKSGIKLIAVGSLKKEKNYPLLIEAFKGLRHLPIYLDIYGGGENLQYYKGLCKHFDNISFKGGSDNIQNIFSDYDLYCSASNSETFGMALLEAACAGLPLLISDIEAFREVAPQGAIFFRKNSAVDFKTKIISIYNSGTHLNDDDYIETMKRFSEEEFLRNILAIYK